MNDYSKNKKMILACLNYLIDNNRDFTLNNLTKYLSEHIEVMEYITEGDLPVNDEVIKAIKERLLSYEIPNENNFKGIVSIDTTIGYRDTRVYEVSFRKIEYFSKDNSYNHSGIQDDTHTIPKEITASVQINPLELNIQPKTF